MAATEIEVELTEVGVEATEEGVEVAIGVVEVPVVGVGSEDDSGPQTKRTTNVPALVAAVTLKVLPV